MPSAFEIVLVPFDDGAILHRRVFDRYQLVEPPACDDEAADMLREMAREAHELVRQAQRLAQSAVARIEPGLAHLGIVDRIAAPAPDDAGERCRHVGREAQGLPHLADGAARAIAAHHRGHPRALAAVFAVDVLDHLLAPLMLEIDVDVGRLVALAADEALEEQINLIGINVGDAEAEAHRRIRRRAAPLAENVLLPGKAHDVLHGEEIRRETELADELELVFDLAADLLRHARGIAPHRPFARQALEFLLRRRTVIAGLVGIIVAELVQGEAAALGDLQRARHRVGTAAEEPRHLRRRLQMAFGMGFQAIACGGDSTALADAGDDVLQLPPLRGVVEHVIGGDERQSRALRQRRQAMEALRIVAAIEHLRREIGAAREVVGELREKRGEARLILRRQRQQQLPFALLHDIGISETALAFLRAALAERQKAREPAVSDAVGRKAEQARRIVKIEPTADHQRKVELLRGAVRPHHARQRVAVGDGDGALTELHRAQHQLRRMRRAAQEREIAGDLQLGIAAHAKTPCRNQRGATFGR